MGLLHNLIGIHFLLRHYGMCGGQHTQVLLPPANGVLMNSGISRQITTSNRINGAEDVAPPAYSLTEEGQPNPAPLVSQALPVWAVPVDSTFTRTSNQYNSTGMPELLPPERAPSVEATLSTVKLLKMCYAQSSALTRSSEQFQVKFIPLSLEPVPQIQTRNSKLTLYYRKSSVRRAGCFSFRMTPPL